MTSFYFEDEDMDALLAYLENPPIEEKKLAIKNALQYAEGDIILFQDSDLEYSPENYPDLLKPFFKNEADVVYGSRLTRAKITKIMGFPNYIGNKIFTLLANFLFNRIYTDIATG